MSLPKIVLILGAGPRIGYYVAKNFADHGYKVAVAARRFKNEFSKDGQLQLHVDLANPEEVSSLFIKVTEKLGIPTVVVYNGAVRTVHNGEAPFEQFSISEFEHDYKVNATSALVAAHEAIKGFAQIPGISPKTFIYTGNKLNVMTLKGVMYFGIAKSSVAHFIRSASVAKEYRDNGYKFYYTDERRPDGNQAGNEVSGPARGELYLQLAEKKDQGPAIYTFITGRGYVDFSSEKQP